MPVPKGEHIYYVLQTYDNKKNKYQCVKGIFPRVTKLGGSRNFKS